MKVAIFSESSADEAALKILVESILGEEVEQSPVRNKLRSRNDASVLLDLPTVMRAIYYTSDAEILIVGIDSDDTPVHKEEHQQPDNQEAKRCRLCILRQIVEEELAKLKSIQGKEMLKVGIAVAVPAMEAWYLCGVNPHVNEPTWIRKQNGESITYDRKKLKIELYGTYRPSIEIETQKAVEAANRLANNLEELKSHFPEGFGSFVKEVQSWKL